MPRCCAGSACGHPEIPFMIQAHYCVTCPESDDQNRGHGPCLIALRLDAAARKLFRLDNDGNGFIKEQHLTESGRRRHGSETNGVCLDCWAKLAEDDEQPLRGGEDSDPPDDIIRPLLNMYSTRSESDATQGIMTQLRDYYDEQEGNDPRSQAFFEKIRQTCVDGARGIGAPGTGGGRRGGGSGLLGNIRAADRREGVGQPLAPPVRGDLAASVSVRR
ncbi:hypothetical protein THAOC_16529, partial [Thalassiosira oceanica]